jgi:hypothetical protein
VSPPRRDRGSQYRGAFNHAAQSTEQCDLPRIADAGALLALITKIGIVGVPHYLPHQEFWLAITAYITLMVGNLVRGL